MTAKRHSAARVLKRAKDFGPTRVMHSCGRVQQFLGSGACHDLFNNQYPTKMGELYDKRPKVAHEANKAQHHDRIHDDEAATSEGIGGKIPPISQQKPPETRYDVRALDLLHFDELPESEQYKLVVDLKYHLKPIKGGPPFYVEAAGAMRTCLKTGNHDAAAAKNEVLSEKAKSGKSREKSKAMANMDCLNHFMNLFTVHDMQKLGKRERKVVGHSERHVLLRDFRIRLAPDYLYTTEVEGKTEVGAVLLVVLKEDRFTASQWRLLAHLLRELVMQQFPLLGDDMPHSRFLVADVLRRRTFAAPMPVDVPVKELQRNLDAYAEVWERA